MDRSLLGQKQRLTATAGMLIAMFLASLDQTVVGTGMPRIVADLGGLPYYAWVGTAFLVGSATMVPIAGRLGDLFGRKRFVLVGIAGFGGTSVLCAMSPSMFELVVSRGLQGLFAGVLMSSVWGVTADLFPPRQRVQMHGMFTGTWALASVLGPTVGGLMTDNLGWRWLFYINLPLALLAFLVALVGMPSVRTSGSRKDIDLPGALLLATTVIPLLSLLSFSRNQQLSYSLVVVVCAIALVAGFSFLAVERRQPLPIIPFALFRERAVWVSVSVSFLSAAGVFGASLFVPLLYQGVRGLSATEAGNLITPLFIAMFFGSIITGQVIVRLKNYRVVGALGFLLQTAGMFLLSKVHIGTTEGEVVLSIVLIGTGTGLVQPLYVNALVSAVPTRMIGVASSQMLFWRQMGATASVALMGTTLTGGVGGRGLSIENSVGRATLAASLGDSFLVGTGLTLAALLVSLLMRDVPLRGSKPLATESNSVFSEAP